MYWDKLSGTSFRQDVIDAMSGEEELILVPDPKNEYDKYAVEVRIKGSNKQVGFIKKGRNMEISTYLQQGKNVYINDYNITGGMDGKSYGINVEISLPQVFKLGNMKKMVPDIGEGYVYFDEENHKYYDEQGNPMMSGSTFEDSQTPDFNPDYPARAISKSTGVKADLIKQFWSDNGSLSADLGTLIHKSIELAIKNKEYWNQIDENRERDVTAKNWMPELLGELVDKYEDKFGLDNSDAEVFVRYKGFCGFIDQLHYLDEKTVEIRDYKIIKQHKKVKTEDYGTINKYALQQNFYRTVIEKAGYKVENMLIHKLSDGEWEEIKLEKVDLDELVN